MPILVFPFFLFISHVALAIDLDPHYKFGTVKPPDSPIQNTWSAFHTDLFTGSFGYEYKIDVPPGVNGLAPEVKLAYNSHSASGKAGWVGAGWDVPLNYIQRDIEYTRKDTSDDTFDLFLSGAKHDLVYVASEDRYHTQIETYHRIEKLTGAPNTSGEYWLVTRKDGTKYRFGYNPDSEHRVNATDGNVPRYVWRWSLDQIQDTNGNQIYFSYAEDQGAVYLSQIEYNNDRLRKVEFILEAGDRPDNYLTIDQGSEVRIARRLREIRVSVNGALARKYLLDYAPNDAQTKSLLTTITQYGADGVTALPPVRFDYHAMNASFGPETSWATPGERWIRKVAGVNTVTDTLDANGDGLPDLVSYDTADFPHWDIWLNERTGFAATNLQWAVPDGWMIRDGVAYVPEQESPDTRTAPMDINRDGYIDFLKAHEETTLQVQLNNGNGFASAPDWPLPTTASIQAVRRPDDVTANVTQEFFDINGDGLPDLVKKEDDTSWHVWRNTGSGFVDFGVWPVPHAGAWLWDFTTGVSNLEVGHYDMNGDGLPDIVDSAGGDWLVYFNTGSDFLPAEVWPTGYSGLIRDPDETGNVKRDLFDINGDDLPDIVNPPSGSDVWEVRLNNGHGFGPVIGWLSNSGITDGFTRDVTTDGHVRRDTLDLDGDGLVDLVRKTDTDWKVYFNQAGQADLLIRVTDTLGGKVEPSYWPSRTFVNAHRTRLPFNFWLVRSVTKNNGMSGAHAVNEFTYYDYYDGFYDFPSREFRGLGGLTEHRYNAGVGYGFLNYGFFQDSCYKGKQKQKGIQYFTNYTEDGYAEYDGFTIENRAGHCKIENNIYYFAFPEWVIALTIEEGGDPYISKNNFTYFQYDDYGNIVFENRMGETDPANSWSPTGDETYIYQTFAIDPTAWIVDRVSQQTTTGASGETLRQANFAYDPAGNLIEERHTIGAGNEAVTAHQYDSYGNRTRTTDPEGRATQTQYDSAFHTFPVATTNAKNQTTQRTYNPINGGVLQEADPNGYLTRYVYDTFQRPIKTIRPYDSEALPTTQTEYALDGIAPERVTVRKRDVVNGQPGTLDTVQVVDGFGKLIQTRSEAKLWGQQIVADVFYDPLYRVAAQSNPYLASYSDEYQPPNTAAPATRYEYDGLDRPVRITNPDGSQVNRQFYLWTVTETDENGHAKVYDFDAYQRLIQVQEQNAGQTYTTRYTYDGVGQLTDVTDHLGNQTLIQYDLLGRKTRMTDPDLGQWNYRYDRVGNLIAQTDARGVTTQFQYDPLNRQTLIDYPHDPDVQLRYDLTTIGTLSEVNDALGGVSFSYDQRLRKTAETRRMDGLEWTTQWSYDALDRVESETHPDGSTVIYDYTAQGTLDAIPGIVSNLDYNANGQVTSKTLANGRTTSYTYHPQNNRLTSIATPALQNLSYQYDAVGNVTSIQDSIAGKTESFSYDDLDRLTRAGDGSYSHQYQYNAIGNLTTAVENGATLTYQYGQGAGPHAVTGLTYPADLDGDGLANEVDPDDDGDGMTDAWEQAHGLNPLNPADAALDLDGDDLTSRQEYQAGADPNAKNQRTCPGADVVLANLVYPAGVNSCTATNSIRAGLPVTVSTGADVTYIAPKVFLLPGFAVQLGGKFQAGPAAAGATPLRASAESMAATTPAAAASDASTNPTLDGAEPDSGSQTPAIATRLAFSHLPAELQRLLEDQPARITDISASADGERIVFSSDAPNLVPDDSNGVVDVFLYEVPIREVRRISVGSEGQQGNGPSYSPRMDGRGEVVAFVSEASNLATNDRNGVADLFLHRLASGRTERLSVGSHGEPANGPSYSPRLDGAGQVVVFVSEASNLVADDRNRVADIFLRDLERQVTERVSHDAWGAPISTEAAHPALDGAGQWILYDRADSDEFRRIYGHQRGFAPGEMLSAARDEEGRSLDNHHPSLSADGRYLAYIEETRDVADSTTACRIVVRERQTARTARLACPELVSALPDPTPVFDQDGRMLRWFREPLTVNSVMEGGPTPATMVALPNPLE